jgi:predicted permease
MRWWNILQSRLRSIVFRDRREADLREELQLHLEREIERLQASGLSREQARLQTLRLFGGVEQIKEASRDARGTGAWDALVRDTRQGRRRLVRDWRFTTAAVLILGLAIGANTAIFSLVNAVLFRDQAVANPDRLVNIYQNDRNGSAGANTYPAYLDMAAYTDIFASAMAASIPDGVRYLHDGVIRNGVVEYTTSTYLDVLGLRPSLGRWFDETENRPGAPVVIVLGREIWTRQFDADPLVIGRTIQIQGLPATIVGVGPANHRGTLNLGLVTDFWVPAHANAAFGGPPRALTRNPVEAGFVVQARLRDGVTVAQATAAMDILGRRLAAEYPDEDPGKGITVLASRAVRIHPQADGLLTALASVVLVIVGLVLAIACSNLATLMLVRGAARAKEVSVRLAMGATRGQVVRHLLTESVLLSLGGGVAGCILAWWGLYSLRGIELPVTVDLSLDYRVLAVAVSLSLVTGLVFGLAPARRSTRIDLLPTLRDDGTQAVDHRRLTLKNALIVFQVAVSVLLLGGTTIFLQMLSASRALQVRYAVDGVAIIETDVRYSGYSAADAQQVYDELRRRVAAIPGVESVALSRGLPMRITGLPIVVDRTTGETGSVVVAGRIFAGPGFFDTLRIPLLHGRVFDARDRAGTPRVAVITETMARQYFGAVNAVGRRFRIENDPNSWTEVVGVVSDTGTGNFDDDVLDPLPQLYYQSYTQANTLPTAIVARTSLDAAGLVAAMQRELRAFDVTLPVTTAKTMAQDLEDSRLAPKAVATFLGVLGGLGLLLASIGLYAIVAFAVTQRAREIGIRMALGAHSRQVVWKVARGVAELVGVGTGVGLMLSALLVLALRVGSAPAPGLQLYRPSLDPLALLAIVGVMALVGAAAAFVPARRAATLDPLTALRHD